MVLELDKKGRSEKVKQAYNNNKVRIAGVEM